MTGPFAWARDDDDNEREPLELLPDRLRSLIRGHQQVNGSAWKPLAIYLGVLEWNLFHEQAFTDEHEEYSETFPGIRSWTYAPNKSILIRLLSDAQTYCRVVGEKQ